MDILTLPSVEQYNTKSCVQTNSLKGKVVLLILRDLMRLNWSIKYLEDRIEIIPPAHYDKIMIKASMAVKRHEIIEANRLWIDKHIDLARANLANGSDVLDSKIQPVVEVCKTQKQHNLFRIFRYYWSSPYSEYVGRRIKLIVRDYAIPDKPVIGIAALGSPIIHIPERDRWIGWDRDTRTENLNYTMDAYVIGALPPYNYLLGGKLMSYILTSDEVRNIFSEKYSPSKYNKLAGIFTTSLYGKSSQYNRIKMNNRLLYQTVGETKGYGTLHLTNETFNSMKDFLKEQDIIVSNRFGDGPIWTMRVIRSAGELLGFNADHLLRHSFKRTIYFVPLATNTTGFLNNETSELLYFNFSLDSLVNYWKNRWFNQRLKNQNIIEKVKCFSKEVFEV
jgi:hypothetical protein